MLRYLEQEGLVVPARSEAGYRRYGIRELNQLSTLAELRTRFGVELVELEFALRLRREPSLRRRSRPGSRGRRPGAQQTFPRGSTGSNASTSVCSPPTRPET
jgi:DNA-binding transcriptional MerR regulator